MQNEKFIRLALKLAEKGREATSPNPMVGAVVAKGDKILSSGYHKKFGASHAEIVALNACGNLPKEATLYLNLEPCCHYGKTPPCINLIIRSGIKRVVCSTIDPNPLVNGKGIRRLRKAGIEVDVGILEKEARKLNEAYFKYITTNIPFVILRVKGTLNGMTSSVTTPTSVVYTDALLWDVSTINSPHLYPLPTGERKFSSSITSIILVGTWNEILICLKMLKPVESKFIILAPLDEQNQAPKNVKELRIWRINRKKNGDLALLPFLKRCGKEGIASLLIERGSVVLSSFLKQKLADKILFEITPDVSGKKELFGDLGIKKMSEAIVLKNCEWRKSGKSLLVSGYPAF